MEIAVAGLEVVLTRAERILVAQGQGAMVELSLMFRIKCTIAEARDHVKAYTKAHPPEMYLGGRRI